ncbi:MAG: hypothetical protein H5T85_06980 [Actinobacteria bacterium]|nr:hypothetical protein [Actinomycetota bacterium]
MARTYKLIPSKTFLKDLNKIPPEYWSKVEKLFLNLKKIPTVEETLKNWLMLRLAAGGLG